MSKLWLSIIILLMGVMLSSIVHQPRMLVIGLTLLAVSQVLMFLAGYDRAKKSLLRPAP